MPGCILVVSGDVRDARRQEVRRLGASDLVPKPLNLDILLDRLREHGVVRDRPAAPARDDGRDEGGGSDAEGDGVLDSKIEGLSEA